MIKTKNIIFSVDDIPKTWIFEYYLGLRESLTGQDIKMKSVFNNKDTNPSLYVYYSKNNIYKFKDFSTGKQGDSIELVREIFNYSKRSDACYKVINDYNNFLDNNGKYNYSEYISPDKYKIKAIKPRNWNEVDKNYWTKYKIGTTDLQKYNIKPLEYYILQKNIGLNTIIIRNIAIYGFFKNNGELYKIYQPLNKENKFFKIKDCIQGLEQLTFKVPYLIICSSLKDIMAFNLMKFKNAEAISPESENTIISKDFIEPLKQKYTKICTLFDNDAAGLKSMLKYEELYNIPYIKYNIEKDLSDSVKEIGINETRKLLYPIITEVLTGTAKYLK